MLPRIEAAVGWGYQNAVVADVDDRAHLTREDNKGGCLGWDKPQRPGQRQPPGPRGLEFASLVYDDNPDGRA